MSEADNPVYEHEYVDQYLKRSSFGLLMLNLWIIWRGVMVIVKGGGIEGRDVIARPQAVAIQRVKKGMWPEALLDGLDCRVGCASSQ